MPSSFAFNLRSLIDEIERLVPNPRERKLWIVDGFDLTIRTTEQFLHEAAGGQVVVDHENA